MIAVLWFIVGLLLLIKGGDWFVDGAVNVARRLDIPDLIIGATVVSIGTTLPEVLVSATSAVGGHSEIAYGNAIGSIICNTALIAAITIAVKPAVVDRSTLRLPVIFFFTAMILYTLSACLRGTFSRPFGIGLLLLFASYLILSTSSALHHPEKPTPEELEGGEEPLWKILLLLIVGAVFIAVGADFLVDNGTLIAEAMHVPESVIALTCVALGTSLPELVTAITSLLKGHGTLSLGNIIGANLFNLVLVCGISITLAPFDVPCSKTIFGMNASLIVDIPLVFFVMAFLTIPALVRGKLSRWQGIVLLIVYALFCVFQFTV